MPKALVTILFYLLFAVCKAQVPATEVRAVWLTTNWNLDWPSPNLSIEGQKEELQSMLNKFQQLNINTVFFQARVRGDVLYNSDIEPRSPFGRRNFDYLEYAIQECHKRGIECHAWVVAFPVGSKKQVAAHGRNSVVYKHPKLCKLFNNEWYLDPGNPDVHNYMIRIINEIVYKYDVDGIHLDYIRYPDKPAKFPDKDTYFRYGKRMALDDWRRDNINRLVSNIYDVVKAAKPWVQVSSSPIGKYKDLYRYGSSWTAHGSVYQDAAFWMQIGKHDALYPMLYYKGDDFYPYLDEWIRHSNDRLIVPGLGAYRMIPSEGNWALKDITDQVDYTREHKIVGQAYFRAKNITDNLKGIEYSLKSRYKYPAKLPAMTWLDSIAPNSPVEIEVFRNQYGKLCLKWQPCEKGETQTFTIYCSSSEDVDVNNPTNILATGIRGNYAELEMSEGEFGLYYSISASDRFHNESVPCFPAYFVHSRHTR